MEDFEKLWNENEEQEQEPRKIEEPTPQYQITEATAYYLLLCNSAAMYLRKKGYAENQIVENNNNYKFHLEKEVKKN